MKVRWVLALAMVSAPLAAQVRVGPGVEATPGVGHVAVAETATGTVSGALDVGYQLIEPLADESSAHHGGSVTLGVAVPIGEWVLASARLHGVGMVHPDDAMGPDKSGVGFPAAGVRVVNASAPLSYGLELQGLFPGQDAPSIDLAATSLRASGLLAYSAPGSAWVVALNIGYFLDNSTSAAPPLARLRNGDRAALGASSFDAVTLGIGLGYQHEAWLVFADASGEVLYGAPRVSTSPMRVGIGSRYGLSESFQFEARAQVGLSARPGFSLDEYQVFEPRFAVFVGPRLTWGGTAEPPPLRPVAKAPAKRSSPQPVPPPVAKPEVEIAYDLVGQVTDSNGAPLAQVALTATAGEFNGRAESGPDGRYRIVGVPPGDVQLRANTVDYEPAATEVHVGKDVAEVEVPPIQLQQQAVQGAQVQGVIRAFNGSIPPAVVTLEPGGMSSATDTEGRFTVEVGPGDYRVTVSAAGYESQTRSITVHKQGVVIVNVDLRLK